MTADTKQEAFQPKRKRKMERRHVQVVLTPAEYERFKSAAADCGVSMQSFAKQAIFYALEHM